MPLKTTNPARGEAAGLGSVVHSQAIDPRADTELVAILQANPARLPVATLDADILVAIVAAARALLREGPWP
jgi:hypothetical protein